MPRERSEVVKPWRARIDKRITHLLRVATRHGGLHFLRDHFLLLTVGDLLGGGGDGLLLKLLGFGVRAQIFMGRGGAGGDRLGSDIRARRFACNIGLWAVAAGLLVHNIKSMD